MATCEAPFDAGSRLCSVCRLTTNDLGLRRCSRIVAESEPMRALLQRTAPIAATDASVIILGESGSGKEVVARALHANSPRKSRPFVPVNVAALPTELLESELFGHARGAFTGATTAKRGLFEEASGGTLFLDEIAEMPLALQAKLLRALQDGEVRRVGEVRPFSVDVRVVCATHQDLAACVTERRFRQDLFFRLKVFTLQVPPLRERVADILPLGRMFLEQHHHATGRFTRAAARLLEGHPWPGNVRELANAVLHGAVLSPAADVDVGHLPEDIAEPKPSPRAAGPFAPLADVERDHIVRVLAACSGRTAQAARVLGIGRTTLWRKMQAYGIEGVVE